MLAAVLGVVVLFGATDYMGARFADIGPQYERFQAGDNNSEVGQRLALWGIALRAARHAPFTGVGFGVLVFIPTGFMAYAFLAREQIGRAHV